MDRYKLDFKVIEDTIKKFNTVSLDIVGDTIVDTFTKCKNIGGQTKTPTLSLLMEKKINYVGGAGVVAKHVAASGAKSNLITVLGNDNLKEFVIKDLKKSKVKFNGIIDKLRPTVNKNVIISDNYRLLRISTLDNAPVSENIISEIKKIIKSKTKGIIFADFRHGIFNEKNIEVLKNQ